MMSMACESDTKFNTKHDIFTLNTYKLRVLRNELNLNSTNCLFVLNFGGIF